MADHIKINGLSVTAPVSVSPWPTLDPPETPVSQPVVISLDVLHDISAAGTSDDLSQSVNYSEVSKIAARVSTEFRSSSNTDPVTALGLADEILKQCLASITLPITELSVVLELPKAVLRAKAASVHICRRRNSELSGRIKFSIKGLLAHTTVGINPQEREDKQPVVVDVGLSTYTILSKDFHFPFAKLERSVSTAIETSSYLTIEALAHEIAKEGLQCLGDENTFEISVSLAKPAALRLADAPEIVIVRSWNDFHSNTAPSTAPAKGQKGRQLAALALGSNLGDRFQNIEAALRLLESLPHPENAQFSGTLSIIDTSFMYETAPMYVLSQPSFINCACLAETTLSPSDLLGLCRHIEEKLGREPGIRFGPRVVDVDIVTYGDDILDTRTPEERNTLDNLIGELVIPHPRMQEREFVLRPLTDVMPEWVHPQFKLPLRSLLSKLLFSKSAAEPPMMKVIPFPRYESDSVVVPSTLTYWTMPELNYTKVGSSSNRGTGRTHIMATLNYTPDSFSDGGLNNTKEAALKYVSDAVCAGADIIDIGGYSTRPGAAVVSAEEETSRVVEAIRAVRQSQDGRVKSVPISVDTFRPSVAEAAIRAGANCINDVYALHGPDYPPSAASEECFREMRTIARRYCVPVVMMHSRGDAGSNKVYSEYTSPRGTSVLAGVQSELAAKVARATKGAGGLRRWQVVVDPGIGFSKTVEGNLELLRDAAELTANNTALSSAGVTLGTPMGPYATPGLNPLAGYPMLIGTSRKSFLGEIIDQTRTDDDKLDEAGKPQRRPANQRDFATAATVACAVQQGAALVRVHEVQGMVDVVKIAEALWY